MREDGLWDNQTSDEFLLFRLRFLSEPIRAFILVNIDNHI